MVKWYCQYLKQMDLCNHKMWRLSHLLFKIYDTLQVFSSIKVHFVLFFYLNIIGCWFQNANHHCC